MTCKDSFSFVLKTLFLGLLMGAKCGSAENRDALRQIVQNQCVPSWRERRDAEPCEEVHLSDDQSTQGGYAILADRKGGAHFLLIPTTTISGIEDQALRTGDVPNYFAAAWLARNLVARVYAKPLSRNYIGLAINSKYTRSQDQLHLHIECIRSRVHAALAEHAGEMTQTWLPIMLDGVLFHALRMPGDERVEFNPFELLQKNPPPTAGEPAGYTLVLTGLDFEDGPGFVVLAGHNVIGGEKLLDSECKIDTDQP